MLATDDETGNAIITLSYWRSMAHLHEFARGPAHQAGWQWFEKMTKTNPHLSFMHEVYAMPKGHWENVYRNFTPFGMGRFGAQQRRVTWRLTWEQAKLDFPLSKHYQRRKMKQTRFSSTHLYPLLDHGGARWRIDWHGPETWKIKPELMFIVVNLIEHRKSWYV
jgi:hypothetical protein